LKGDDTMRNRHNWNMVDELTMVEHYAESEDWAVSSEEELSERFDNMVEDMSAEYYPAFQI